jgi:insulysin
MEFVNPCEIKYDGKFYKHKNDTKEYFHYKLDNMCNVFFIIDPKIKKSSVSFDMLVGHKNNNHDGMAHLLEHMLFMGSKKYPDAQLSQEYISNHGGYTNAYTTNKNTNYYFDINSDYFEKAYDIFCNLFIDPTFDEKSIKSEIKIIQSEHEKNINSDLWRIRELIKIFIKNKINFGTGTSEIFNSIPNIKNSIRKFFNDNYSANLLTIFIYHNNQNCIQNILHITSQIKNHNHKNLKEKYIFNDNNLILKVKMLSEQYLLKIYVLKDNLNGIDIIDKFIYHLSLILKKLNLILEYDLSIDNNINSLITITFKVNSHGLKNFSSIINILRSYFYDLNNIQKYIDEDNKLRSINMKNFKDHNVDIEEYVNIYETVDIKYLFSNNYRKTIFTDYEKFRNNIINEKFNLVIGSNLFEGDLVDIHYPTKYKIYKIPNSEILKIKLSLPIINQFINTKYIDHNNKNNNKNSKVAEFTKIKNFYTRKSKNNAMIIIIKMTMLEEILGEYDNLNDNEFIINRYIHYIITANELLIYDLYKIGIELSIKIKKDLLIISLIGSCINNDIIDIVIDMIFGFFKDEYFYEKVNLEICDLINNYWYQSPYEIIETEMKGYLFPKHHIKQNQFKIIFERNKPSKFNINSFIDNVKNILSHSEIIGFLNGNYDFEKVINLINSSVSYTKHNKTFYNLEFNNTTLIKNQNIYEKNIGVSFGLRLCKGNNKKHILMNRIIRNIISEKVSSYIREKLGYVVIVKLIDMNRSYENDNYLIIIFQTMKEWKKIISDYMNNKMISDILDKNLFETIKLNLIKTYETKIYDEIKELKLFCNYVLEFDIQDRKIKFLNNGITKEHEMYIKILKELNYSDLEEYSKSFDNKFMIQLRNKLYSKS